MSRSVAAMPPEPLEVVWISTAVVISSSWIVWRMMLLARFLGVTTNQLARARQELQVQATHDPLTGLLNRAVLDDVLGDLERPAHPEWWTKGTTRRYSIRGRQPPG